MKLKINRQYCEFIPIQVFREHYGLDKRFSITLFEPKEWQGLGSLDKAGDLLSTLQRNMIARVPKKLSPTDLLGQVDVLTRGFRQELNLANASIGLRDVEVDFATAGFGDVLQATAYYLFQLSMTHRGNPATLKNAFSFFQVYQDWLDASVRLSANTWTHYHSNLEFTLQVVYYAYGRVGMQITMRDELSYIYDGALACPAAGFMAVLTEKIAYLLLDSLLKE